MQNPKVGQHVRVVVEGTVTAVDSAYVILDGRGAEGAYIGQKHASRQSLEILPDPIKVGNRVRSGVSNSHLTGIVRAIDEGHAAVKWENGIFNVWTLKNLVLAPKGGC